MDYDINMDDVADGFAPPTATIGDNTSIAQPAVAPSPSNERDLEDSTIVRNKVHIRGLDTLTTDDIKNYVKSHFGPPERVEWIDDESANLLFGSESTAQEALAALSAIEIADVTQLPPKETIPAKAVTSHPDVNLQIRFAVVSDRKIRGAAERSRFYLLHPEFDPEERRQREGNRNRYRNRDGDDRRRNGRGRNQRDRDSSPEVFHASMYDDDEDTLADRRPARHPRSRSREPTSREERSYSSRNQEKELFPSRLSGAGKRQRNRSASPMRDLDGDAAMDVEAARAPRASNRNNRERASGIRDRLAEDNNSRELFPTKGSSMGKTHMDRVMDGADEATRIMQQKMSVSNDRVGKKDLFDRDRANTTGSGAGFSIKGAAGANVKELFPSRFGGGGNTGKELFADKLEGRGRRRQKAEDLFS
ncbi:hypothetical protein CSAL01_00535 [Colletotrichum salicis]|uniref:Uncharacterized protein n=1 Tax=Colletotrichum salicis TaxID=1209931 RepID=A0A135S3K5_9PEZI|nr:hypothetical protein CSAL01_00535 [Colletotrichum salicis]